MPKTVPDEAPRHFSVAIDVARRLTKAATALAMPAPPTISEARPTSVMKYPRRSMKRSAPWAAWFRLRARQPASGNFALASSITASAAASVGSGSFTR